MGMFDSMFDADGNEWQTKAFGRTLERWRIGDSFPTEIPNFQCRVLGDIGYGYATIRGCKLAAVPAERDSTFLLIDYFGGILELPAKEMN